MKDGKLTMEEGELKTDTKVKSPALKDGLCRLPIEAIDVENDWQVAQDHIEDGNTAEALKWLMITAQRIGILHTKLIKDRLAT